MKKLLSYTTILVLCVGCFDNDFVTKPVFIDDTYMGRESTSTKIVSLSSRTTTGKYSRRSTSSEIIGLS